MRIIAQSAPDFTFTYPTFSDSEDEKANEEDECKMEENEKVEEKDECEKEDILNNRTSTNDHAIQ
jgi:hypothetical protein